jgi:hypothetical protein
MKLAFGINAGSGKDTSVDYMIFKYGGKKYSFSEPLYDIMHYSQRILNKPMAKDRKFLQMFGDFCRSDNTDIFVDLCLEKIKNDSQSNVYISDLRFENEFRKLKDAGFKCIKLIRDVDNSTRIANGDKNHCSEVSLKNVKDEEWDFIIYNNSTLDHLYEQLDNIKN